MFNLVINTHHSCWDCEDCGLSRSEIISFESDEFGSFSDGDEALCYGYNNGCMITVLNELNTRLLEKGIVITLKELGEEYLLNEEKFELMNWMERETWNDEEKSIYEKHCTLNEEYESFYLIENLSKYYEKFGVSLSFTSSYDSDD